MLPRQSRVNLYQMAGRDRGRTGQFLRELRIACQQDTMRGYSSRSREVWHNSFPSISKGICLPTESLALFAARSRVPWYSVAAGALLPRWASAGGLEGPCRYIPRLRPSPRAFPADRHSCFAVHPGQRDKTYAPRESPRRPGAVPDGRGTSPRTYAGDAQAYRQSLLGHFARGPAVEAAQA